MATRKVKITNIHEAKRFPNVIYAELRDATDGSLWISATLSYIFQSLHEVPDYDCVNVSLDKFGNYSIIP